jgi:hypothetical protein
MPADFGKVAIEVIVPAGISSTTLAPFFTKACGSQTAWRTIVVRPLDQIGDE